MDIKNMDRKERQSMLTMFFYRYRGEDLTKMNRYIKRNYGKHAYVFHEKTSKYVHTDLYPILPDETKAYYTLVSLGMGTDDMYINDVRKAAIELVLYLSETPDQTRELNYAAFLTNLTKLPFSNETFFDVGHTLEFSDYDKTVFPNYDGFAFRQSRTRAGRADAKVYLPGIERTVRFLDLVPVFADEFDLIHENTAEFFDWIDKEFGVQGRFADIKREQHFTFND